MKVSREEAARNRDRVIATAVRRYKEAGFDGIGVADLMKEAGLTHGAFYGQFDSKDDLMSEAVARAAQDTIKTWERLGAKHPGAEFAAIARNYLSAGHRDEPGGEGCCMTSTLGAESVRQSAPVRQAFGAGLRSMLNALSGFMPGNSAKAKQDRAILTFSTMLGALVMARATPDKLLSDRILAVARDGIDTSAG